MSLEQSSSQPDSSEKRMAPNTSQSTAKEDALSQLLLAMDDYAPLIPDAVTDYHLARGGFESDDLKLKRVLSLAAQKFIVDIASDAIQYAKIRGSAAATKDRKSTSKSSASGSGSSDKKTVLTMDDLAAAMAERGVNIKKPDYYL